MILGSKLAAIIILDETIANLHLVCKQLEETMFMF